MKINSKVSVLIPAYNCEDFIEESIDSVLNQDYDNFECIVLDDGSSDKTLELLKKYKDKRLKVYENKINLGIERTRNKLFEYVSEDTDYIMIFDSDDVAMPDKMRKQASFLDENPDYGVVGSSINIIDEDSKVIAFRGYASDDASIRKTMFRASPFAQPSVMIRKEVYEKLGGYDERYNTASDYDYWLRIAVYYKLKNFKEPLIKYRISTRQVKNKKLKQTLKNTILIKWKWRRYFGVFDFVRFVMELGFYLMPNRLVMWLFKKKTYRRVG